jgi:hypothetical protein
MSLVRPILILTGFLAPWCAVQGQDLRDPTRPPFFARASSTVKEASQPAADLVLQTVLVSPQRRNAVISGRLVHLGDSISGMRVVAIRESEVVLRSELELRTLQLFPGIAKQRPDASGSMRDTAPRRGPKADDAG